MQHKTPSGITRTRTTRRRLLLAATLTFASHAAGEVESELDPLVVSALRTPLPASETTSAVTRLDPLELESRGILDLRDALNEVPGVIATSTAGQTGAIGSVFVRGTTTAYSQLVVDGIRLSDATAPLGNFFAGARLDDLGAIEVLRGPQAAIHGGESVGGVIWLQTARGEGDPRTRLRLEGGSFDTFDTHLSHSGAKDGVSWFAGVGYGGTHNDAADQDYDQSRAALRLEWEATDNLTLGMTFRSVDSRFDYPFFGANTDRIDATLATVFADARIAPGWNARFTAGHYAESYDNDSIWGNYGTDLERTVVNTDHVIEVNGCHKLLAGAYFEHTDFRNTIGTDAARDRFGGYLGWQWQPSDRFVADAVVRWEDDQSYGDEFTWRTGAAWNATGTTRIRGGIGRAFRTPTYLDLFGTAFGAGNPNLGAETSIGWDLGIEQRIGEHHTVSVTWFENSIEDRIRSFPTPPVNLPGETPTRGLETALQGEWCDGQWRYRLAWTFLDESLQDQPDHTATASLDWRPVEKLLLGIGASYVDERSWGGRPLDDYLLLRLYGSYQLTERVRLHGRIENLADTGYQLSNFGGSVVEGPGLGAFAGVTLEF
ncbi:TonB-dependent receptor [Haloferula helveola]|uniref:TonB-dependent receptor n=1 Tax=Haloferula helveola TaxID=490095 RepID=A0ABM7RK40_9BACT|nr:TonB-dependent receptor [Haloferula helveola]